MALSIEEDTRLGFDAALRALVSILDRQKGMEEGWSVLGLGGSLAALLLDAFSELFYAGTSFSYVNAFLTGCRVWILTSYRV